MTRFIKRVNAAPPHPGWSRGEEPHRQLACEADWTSLVYALHAAGLKTSLKRIFMFLSCSYSLLDASLPGGGKSHDTIIRRKPIRKSHVCSRPLIFFFLHKLQFNSCWHTEVLPGSKYGQGASQTCRVHRHGGWPYSDQTSSCHVKYNKKITSGHENNLFWPLISFVPKEHHQC